VSYLLTNGCSFVWGDELEGYDNDPPSHHHLTFSHLLSKKLDVPLVNLASCGACNYKIFRDTTDHLRKAKELPSHIVILWSAWQRDETPSAHHVGWEDEIEIQRWQCMTQISPSRTQNVNSDWYGAYEMYYAYVNYMELGIIRTIHYMTHMQWLCETLGIKLIQGVFHQRMWKNLLGACKPIRRNPEENWGPWIDYIQDSLGSLKPTSRIGLGSDWPDLYQLSKTKYTIKPFAHPDEDAQVEYADMLYNIFQNEFDK